MNHLIPTFNHQPGIISRSNISFFLSITIFFSILGLDIIGSFHYNVTIIENQHENISTIFFIHDPS
jgi:hypothetical protein